MKERLANLSGVNVDNQVLVHKGRTLDDDLTANYYNIEGGTVLDLVVGGGAPPRPALGPMPFGRRKGSKIGPEAHQPLSPSCRTGGQLLISGLMEKGAAGHMASCSTLAPNA